MTPERCTGLAALLIEFRDWVVSYSDDAPLDVAHIDHVIDVIGLYRRLLAEDIAVQRAAMTTGGAP